MKLQLLDRTLGHAGFVTDTVRLSTKHRYSVLLSGLNVVESWSSVSKLPQMHMSDVLCITFGIGSYLNTAFRCPVILIHLIYPNLLRARVLALQQLRDCRELNVARPLINRPYLAVSPHLLRNTLPHESHSAHPLNSQTTHSASDL